MQQASKEQREDLTRAVSTTKEISDRQREDFAKWIRIARRANRIARETLVATNRPQLIIRQITISDSMVGRRFIAGTGAIDFTIANIGSGPATIVESNFKIRNGGESDELEIVDDGHPIYDGESGKCVGRMLAPGEHFRETLTEDASIVADFMALARQGRGISVPFGLYGYIVYEDAKKVRRTTAFWRRYHSATHRFNAADDTDYEYQD